MAKLLYANQTQRPSRIKSQQVRGCQAQQPGRVVPGRSEGHGREWYLRCQGHIQTAVPNSVV